jgi:hypothetical protein
VAIRVTSLSKSRVIFERWGCGLMNFCLGFIISANTDVLHFLLDENNLKVSYSQLTNSVTPETEGSSPHSQQPANDPCPEPGESTTHPPNQSP